MNVSDGEGDTVPKTIPELIKHLWDLYHTMSLDPVLASSAEQVKQAALTLEETRRLAFQIYQEEQHKAERPKKTKRKETGGEATKDGWFRSAKTASPLKH